MYRVFPFEQTAQWWSFVWSCLTLKFPWQERKHNSDIFVCFRNFVQRKVGWNLIEVMFFRRRWELFFHQGVRLYLITLESASLTVNVTWGGGGWMKTLYIFSPFTLMSASWTVTTAWRGGWMKAPCWLLSPLNYSGKMDVSLRQIVPGISYRDQTGLQINVSEKWETGVKKNAKRRKGFRILGFRWNKVGE